MSWSEIQSVDSNYIQMHQEFFLEFSLSTRQIHFICTIFYFLMLKMLTFATTILHREATKKKVPQVNGYARCVRNNWQDRGQDLNRNQACNDKVFGIADLRSVCYFKLAAFKVLLWNIAVVKSKYCEERKLMQWLFLLGIKRKLRS